MIEIRNVWKRYGDNVILENISATVKEGEFITLVGASGCGKSTFLRLLLGTEVASQGEVLLDGKVIADEPDAERGVVFQQYSVFPHMTVLENVTIARAFEGSALGFLWGKRKRAAREEASRETRELSAVLVVKDGYSPQEFYIAGSEQSPSSDRSNSPVPSRPATPPPARPCLPAPRAC